MHCAHMAYCGKKKTWNWYKLINISNVAGESYSKTPFGSTKYKRVASIVNHFAGSFSLLFHQCVKSSMKTKVPSHRYAAIVLVTLARESSFKQGFTWTLYCCKSAVLLLSWQNWIENYRYLHKKPIPLQIPLQKTGDMFILQNSNIAFVESPKYKK